jgi:putative transposase
VLPDASQPPTSARKPPGIAPLLRALMADYAATGLPPAYLPTRDTTDPNDEDKE